MWTYTKSFPSPPPPPAGTPPGTATLLVLDGVKMPATVSVNGVPVGHTTNQFLRYTFDVTAALHAPGGPPNALALAFDSADDTTEGRFMASSGGWDWAACVDAGPLCGRRTLRARDFSSLLTRPACLPSLSPHPTPTTAAATSGTRP